MTTVLFSLLIIAILVILFLYTKLRKIDSVVDNTERKQKESLEDARILKEIQERNKERLEKSKNAQEAIDKFKSAMDDLSN